MNVLVEPLGAVRHSFRHTHPPTTTAAAPPLGCGDGAMDSSSQVVRLYADPPLTDPYLAMRHITITACMRPQS